MTITKITEIIKSHWVFLTGVFWFLLVIVVDVTIRTFDLQYDDGGLGTILILGEPVLAFPFWFFSEVDLFVNRIVPGWILVLLLFLTADIAIWSLRK